MDELRGALLPDPDLDPAGRDARLAPLPRGPHGLPREEVCARHAERLMAAVVRESAEVGWPRVTVAALCARGRLSKTTFYGCVADLHEAFALTWRTLLARLLPDPCPADLEATVAAMLDGLATHPDAARLLLVDGQVAGGRMEALRTEAVAELGARLRALDPTPRPAVVYESAVLMSMHALAQHLRRRPAATLPELGPEVVALLRLPFTRDVSGLTL